MLTFLLTKAKMNIRYMIIIAMNIDRFVRPLAELSVTLLWYFWTMDSLV